MDKNYKRIAFILKRYFCNIRIFYQFNASLLNKSITCIMVKKQIHSPNDIFINEYTHTGTCIHVVAKDCLILLWSIFGT